MAENIADKLLSEAEYGSVANTVSWLRLMVLGDKSGAINLGSCGVYLYDGIAGILVFLFLLSTISSKEKYREICRLLEKQLFTYTDTTNKDHRKAQSGHSGIYNGEGAIVYTYLILFMISGEKIYIEYAEKHAKTLRKIVEEDKNCDLLDGKAGAVIVFCYMYLLLRKKEYIEAAIDAGEKLTSEAIHMNEGIGWKQADGGTPLLGIAHGNAGILIALSMLYKITKDKKYYDYMKGALSYEHRNFNYATGDWIDFRQNGNKKGHIENSPAAWCHGAGGILLSRLIMEQIGLEQEELKILRKDIKRAVSFLQKNQFRKELCLCHGECGNLLIFDACKERIRTEGCVDTNTEEANIVEDIVLTREWYTPGLMNGYSGIGYYLLLQITDIPNYLFLDVKLRTITDKLRTNCKME